MLAEKPWLNKDRATRTGIILSYRPKDQVGMIADSNEQKIKFRIKENDTVFKKSDLISFEIELTDRGLMATNVCPLF